MQREAKRIKETNGYLRDEDEERNEDGRSVESKKFLYLVSVILLASSVCSRHGWQELYGASFRKTKIMGKLRLPFSPGQAFVSGKSRGAWWRHFLILEVPRRSGRAGSFSLL